jgi:ABC-type sugar transport system ATPase subunit
MRLNLGHIANAGGQVRAMNGVSFTAKDSEVRVMLGPSGFG